MKAYWVIVWLINQSEVLVLSQAPGDQDNFCTTLSASITPPSYPPNSIILMDSYNYIRLLPSAHFPNAGIWQQVDVDGVTDTSNNNAPTNWLQPTSSTCRHAVSSCYFNLAPPSQNNWLITQHISREVNGSLLPQVIVQVEFQLTGCSAGCQRSFLLEVWETSNIDLEAARNTTQYRRIQRVAPNSDSGLLSQNASIPVTFNTNETGFYLAFVDDNTCIAVTRIIVFYYVCPEMVQDFIVYPETLSPPINTLQPQTRQVQGQCVEGAEGQLSGKNPSLQCIQAGKWGTLQPGTGCQCRDGFVPLDSTNECKKCAAGKYVSSFNNSCQPCPANTGVDQEGVTVCPCLDGYLRASGQDDDSPCTRCPAGKYASSLHNSCQTCPANTRVDQVGVTMCPCLDGYYRASGEDSNFPCTMTSDLRQDSIPAIVYAVLSIIIILLAITLLVVSSCYVSTMIKYKRLSKNVHTPHYYDIASKIQPEENPSYGVSRTVMNTENETDMTQNCETMYEHIA